MTGKKGAAEAQFSSTQEPIARIEGAADCGPREVSTAELRELVGAGSDWIWETDSELRFSWLSGNYEEITGILPAKVLGHFRFDFLKKASKGADSAAAHLADLEARRPFRDFVYELAGGRHECRWVATSGYPRFDEAGTFIGYRGVGRNVTSIAASLEETGNSGSKAVRLANPGDSERARSDLARALDSMRMGIVLVDADLNAEIVNQAFYDIWKVTPDDVGIGSPFRALMDINRHNGIYQVSDDKWESYVAMRLDEIRAGDVAPREFRRADGCTMIYSVTALSDGKRLISYYDITEMKDREAKLAAALERSELADAVINGVKDPIFVKDSDLKFVFANEAFSKLFGVRPEEMLGKKGGDFVSPEEAVVFEQSERDVLETGQFYEIEENFEFAGIGRSRIVRKNKVAMDSGKDYVACFVFDITDMKRREVEAEEARQQLANVLESLPAGVIIYDRDDKFVFANRKLQESLPALMPAWKPGCTFPEALELGHSLGYFRMSGDPAVDVLYDTDPAAWLDGMMAHCHLRHSVFERQNSDGRWYQVYDMRISDGTFIGVRVDITDLKDREKALHESMRQIDLFRHVLDELPVATNIKGEDLRLEYVNKTWCAFTGIAKEEAVGKSDAELFGAAEAEGFTTVDSAVGASGERLETEEAVTHRNGTVRQLMTRKGRLVAIDGSVHLFGSSTDITDIKLREAELRESLRENEVFRSLIDNVPVAIYAKRPDLKLYYVNKGWCDLTGFSKEQAIGKTDAEIFGEDGRAFMDGDLAVLETGEKQEVEETAGRQTAAPASDRPQERDDCYRRLPLSDRVDHRHHRIEAARAGIARGAASSRAGGSSQVGIPGQYEPRDPHADERRAGHGRTAGQIRSRCQAEDVHRYHREVRQCAADHHQRHSRFLEDRRWPACARSGALQSGRGDRGCGDAGLDARQGKGSRTHRSRRAKTDRNLHRGCRKDPADHHQSARQCGEVHQFRPCAGRCDGRQECRPRPS